jgi:uncharacterized membrane protein YhiD involved in acid resistance
MVKPSERSSGVDGGPGARLIVGAVVVAAALTAILVVIPGGQPDPTGTVAPNDPLARLLGDVQGMLAPGSQSLPVVLAKLILAALLGGIIGYRQRPRHEGDSIIQAYIIIGFTGAMMMILIGNELVRAVSLLGASSIIRYRTPIKDPKALAALFVTLGIGIAVGLSLYELALGASVLLVGLQVLASTIADRMPPTPDSHRRSYRLRLTTEDGAGSIAQLEKTFAARGIYSRLHQYDVREGKRDLVKITMSVEAAKDMPAQELASLVLADGVRSVHVEQEDA